MSQLYDLRSALAAAIVAADIGWTADTILLKRQTDLGNDIATALSTAGHGAVLHIGIAEGAATEDSGLELEITLPLTIVCLPQVTEGAVPEEDLWEALVAAVHDLRLPGKHFAYRFKFKSFSDADFSADGGTAYLARQTVFACKFSL